MNKRGQFYLIAAIIIVTVVASITSIFTNAKKPVEEVIVYDLAKEVSYESHYSIDAGVFQLKNDSQINFDLENLSDSYSLLNPKTDILAVFGNDTSLTFILYQTSEIGRVGVSFGGDSIDFPQINTRKLKEIRERNNSDLLISLEDTINYTYNFRKGKVFFTVLKKEREGERFVALSEF